MTYTDRNGYAAGLSLPAATRADGTVMAHNEPA